jgi:hypothetical protein
MSLLGLTTAACSKFASDTVAALSIPARGRAPTLADIEAFVSRQPSS